MYDLDGTPRLDNVNPKLIAETLVKLEKLAGLQQINFEYHYQCRYTLGGLRSVENHIKRIQGNITKLLRWVKDAKLTPETAYVCKQILHQHQIAKRDAILKESHITNFLSHESLSFFEEIDADDYIE
jgi:hypothetical protein